MSAIKLNIGCGSRILEDYLNIDQDSIYKMQERYPDIKFNDNITIYNWDVFNLPIADNSVQEVRADCFLEHLSFVEEKKFLTEVKRVLKIGGVLNLAVPDFEEIVKLWLSVKDDWQEFYRDDQVAINNHHWFGNNSYALDNRWGYLTAVLFGSQKGEGQYHKNCYTKAKLLAMLNYFGFRDITIRDFFWKDDREPMLRVTAIKG